MPDSISRCGEPNVPPLTITSRVARMISRPFFVRISTPDARPFSMTTRATWVLGRTVRFAGRSSR